MGDAQELDISTMPFEQLAMLKGQFEQEVEQFSRLYESLREGISRFEQADIALKAVTAESSGTPLLVPMTSSLYVPGKIVDADKVLVDVGTGYFVEKDRKSAVDYIQKKLDLLLSKEKEAEQGLALKRDSLRTIQELLEYRMREIQQSAPKQ